MAEAWHIEPLDKRRVCQKRRRFLPGSPLPLDTLPAEWRELLARWVLRGGNSKWDTLRKDAGVNRVQLADDLLNWLLRHRWAHVVEHREHSAWWPKQVELQQLPQLRAALGLRNKDADAQRWTEIRADLAEQLGDTLAPALLALDDLPPARALSRHDLITALRRWQLTQQNGTRRDFALFARGDTKALSDAEWNWLESLLDLAEVGIERHTPLLLIAAPFTLHLPQGHLDLAAAPDFAALTPASIASIDGLCGTIKHWHLIENRTSFDRQAKRRATDIAIVWLPGFPPGWWCEAMRHLLSLAPAPALLSCDPDPAGIAIALKAAELWQERGLAWQPEKMSVTDLAALPARKTLSDVDRQRLAAIQTENALPPELHELANWMQEHGEKGEQEGYL